MVESNVPDELEKIEKLLEAANDDSKTVSGLHIAFLAFAAYCILVITQTTPEQLLKDAPVKLPLLDAELRLTRFYFWAPILLVIMHINLLLQMELLSSVLWQLDEELDDYIDQNINHQSPEERKKYTEEVRERLHIFPLTYLIAGRPKDRGIKELLSFIVCMTDMLLTLFVLVHAQVTFLAYHHEWITMSQRILVWVDFLFTLFMTVQIMTNDEWKRTYKISRWIWFFYKFFFTIIILSLAIYFVQDKLHLYVIYVFILINVLYRNRKYLFEIYFLASAYGYISLSFPYIGYFFIIPIIFICHINFYNSDSIQNDLNKKKTAEGILYGIVGFMLMCLLVFFSTFMFVTPGETTVYDYLFAENNIQSLQSKFHWEDTLIKSNLFSEDRYVRVLTYQEGREGNETPDKIFDEIKLVDYIKEISIVDVKPTSDIELYLKIINKEMNQKKDKDNIIATECLKNEFEADNHHSYCISEDLRRYISFNWLRYALVGEKEKQNYLKEKLSFFIDQLPKNHLDLRGHIFLHEDIEPDVQALILKDAHNDKIYPAEKVFNQFIGLELKERDLRYAYMVGATLPKVILNKADLRNGNFSGVDMRKASLVGADLRGAIFAGANLRGSDMRGAKLQGADFRAAKLEGADFGVWRRAEENKNSIFSPSYLEGANFSGAFLSRVKFYGAQLQGAKLEGANLNKATFNLFSEKYPKKDIHADLSGANLHGARFTKNAEFKGAILQGTNLQKGASKCKNSQSKSSIIDCYRNLMCQSSFIAESLAKKPEIKELWERINQPTDNCDLRMLLSSDTLSKIN